MKKFKNHQRPRRKYSFDIVGHKKALKIWWDSPFKQWERESMKGIINGSGGVFPLKEGGGGFRKPSKMVIYGSRQEVEPPVKGELKLFLGTFWG